MPRSQASWLAVALAASMASLPLATAQGNGWEAGQVNATMCYWMQPRGAVVRDTVYMDGGSLYWVAGMSNGEYGVPEIENNNLGLMYALNFSTPFNVTGNLTGLFTAISKSGGGSANNVAPNYFDGALLANNNELNLYGGLLAPTDDYVLPDGEEVASYRLHASAPGQSFLPGLVRGKLPEGVTRYLAYGGAASAPSENKAWYFSGLRSPTSGPIFDGVTTESLMAVNVSTRLITLDMAQSTTGRWRNDSLPDFIKGRANPELVWVPYGAQGLLVVLGGVTYPEFVSSRHQSTNAAASDSEGRMFMNKIDVYDIASGEWYQQETNGAGPAALTRGCAVAAYAQDMSSVNIYHYGGYNGLDPKANFNDDVWILSLPSFHWMKVSSGMPSKGRAGHKCFMPYPDQMIVVGGYTSMPGQSPRCLEGGIVRVLNLTSTDWMDSYDPAVYGKYGVPEMIHDMIGGNYEGSATAKMPEPTGWATAALSSVFATTYPTAKISTYYPYSSGGAGDNTNPDFVNGGGGSNLPSYVPIVVGVVGGLIVLTIIVVAFWLYRRRKLLRRGAGGAAGERGMSDVGTEKNSRVRNWVFRQSDEHKAPPTVSATEDTPFSDVETGTPAAPPHAFLVPPPPGSPATPGVVYSAPPAEMADTQVAELMDTSPRVELQDTGLTPVEVINKHTHLGQQYGGNNGSVGGSTYYSSLNQTDHASTISRSSGPSGLSGGLRAPPPPALEGIGAAISADSPVIGRADSPPLGAPGSPPPAGRGSPSIHSQQGTRFVSGVSGISEGERRHLRQVSDETVSSFNTGVGGAPVPASMYPRPLQVAPREQDEDAQTPVSAGMSTMGPQQPLVGTPPLVSPPSAGIMGEADDYLSARQQQQQQQQQPLQQPGTPRQGNANVNSPLRRSVFRENEEDLGGRP